MTPGFQAAISRLEGQWRNLFRRIRRIRRSAAILCFFPGLSLTGIFRHASLGNAAGAADCFRGMHDGK